MEISAGKLRALRRLADDDGRFKMIAVDQRPPMLKALAGKFAPLRPSYADLAAVKKTLAGTLLPHGSALLIDPDYGFTAAEPVIPPGKGLLVTLEDFDFDETPAGRKSRVLQGWSVEKIKRMGADGVKLLLWYRPDAAADVLEHQRHLVREVGDACRAYDLPFLLELLVYPFKGSAGHNTDYGEHGEKYPDLVLQSLRDFASHEFGVDIYKIESPILTKELPDPTDDGPATRAAQGKFDEITRIIGKPWVMLSAGASMEVFRRVLGFAYRAGANGYLAGRAIWWPSFECYPDIAAMTSRLQAEGLGYMHEINALTAAAARPWTEAPDLGGNVAVAAAGHAFPTAYPGFA
ncbi:MAG TPA: tagatose 1,6-diphosphate aldolase [Dongiaceae bacterium]|nr:tagatose 1,6-diphosphate aldolase [Dongiaceae bacterium]